MDPISADAKLANASKQAIIQASVSNVAPSPTINLKIAVDACVTKLQQQGYLQKRKTVREYGLDQEGPHCLNCELDTWMVTENHPCIVLGECLPIDFQKECIDVIVKDRSGDNQTCGRGSLMGNVYRHLFQEVDRQVFVSYLYGQLKLPELFHSIKLPSVIHTIIEQYVVSPALLLYNFILSINPIITETFGFQNTSTSEDFYLIQQLQNESQLLHRIAKSYAHTINPALNQQEQEIQLLGNVMRGTPYPYSYDFQSDWCLTYDAVQEVCTTLNSIRHKGF
jgi:hypothetical protein